MNRLAAGAFAALRQHQATAPRCSRCRRHPRRAPGQRYCMDCHAAYMTRWRKQRTSTT